MGLLTGLLTLPLAPVRGVVWVAEQVAEQVRRELYDEASIRRQLAEAEAEHARGALTDGELATIQDTLLDRLLAARAGGR